MCTLRAIHLSDDPCEMFQGLATNVKNQKYPNSK